MKTDPPLPNCRLELYKFEKENAIIEAIPAIKNCEPLQLKTGLFLNNTIASLLNSITFRSF